MPRRPASCTGWIRENDPACDAGAGLVAVAPRQALRTQDNHATGKLLTQFIANVPLSIWQTVAWAIGMDAMCTMRIEALSFPGLLEDPLIRMVMDSDGVSDGELRELMTHLREIVSARTELGLALRPEQVV